MASTYARFWALVDRSGGARACWPWTGACTPRGVPVFEVRRKRTTARRYAYRLEHGDPGDRFVVRVTCGNVVCCNPKHLQIRTKQVVAVTNGSAAARNAAKTSCMRGHPFTAENTYRHANGRRECRKCKADRRHADETPTVGSGGTVASTAAMSFSPPEPRRTERPPRTEERGGRPMPLPHPPEGEASTRSG